jgi:hypothetical protein
LVNEPGVKRPAIGVAPLNGLKINFNQFNFQVEKCTKLKKKKRSDAQYDIFALLLFVKEKLRKI